MAHYIISYDLRKQRDYKRLWDALKISGAVRLLESLWLVELKGNSGLIRDQLRALTDADDGVIVIELKPGSEWSAFRALPAGTTWLNNHIRRY